MKKHEEKTVKMVFHEDKFFNDDIAYEKEKVHEVPLSKKERWQKRGGIILTDAQAKEFEKAENKQEGLKALLAKDLAKEVKADGQPELAEEIKAGAEGDVTVGATTPEQGEIVEPEVPQEIPPVDETHDGEELEEGEEVEDSKDESGASKKSGKKAKKAKK